MTLSQLKTKFNTLLSGINGSTSSNFSTTVETGYEAFTLASVMIEYKRIYGAVSSFTHPTNSRFLNQKPGRFRIDRSFRLEFVSGETFYFATDIEVFGINAFTQSRPLGILFEVDVVVIPEASATDVIANFGGYPAPQHIDSAYECKFGQYHKGQLRELLGLKRHLSLLVKNHMTPVLPNTLFTTPIINSRPAIALKMARPIRHKFFDIATATLYDLEQIIVK